MEQTEELRLLIEQSNLGYKILSGAFSLIVLLLLYIWRQMIKSNNTRHENNEELLKTAMANQSSLILLVNRHDVEIDHLKKKAFKD